MSKEASKRWRERHPVESQAKQNRYYEKHPERHLLTLAKCRAKKQELPFDITAEDIHIPEYCPILGIKLESGIGKGKDRNDNIPSLDKIVPRLGYVKGNVWVISLRANKLKNDATLTELELIVSALRKVS